MRRFVFAVLFISLGINAFSLEEDKVIGSITISGLKRTRESVIHKILEVEEGDNFSSFDEEAFRQGILKTKILRPGKITYNEQDDCIDINIEIMEKWTLLPLPMVSLSRENQFYGLVIMEQNFLGLRKVLVVRAGYSTLGGPTGGIMYRDMDILPGDLYLLTDGSFINNSDESYINASGSLGIGKEFNKLKLQSLFKYDYFLFDSSEQNQFISNLFNIAYNDLYYTSTIQTGTSLSLTLAPGWDFEESTMFFNLNSSINYNKEIFRNLYLAGRLSSQHFNSPTPLERYWGGSDNSRTLIPVLCDQYIGGSAMLEYAFLNFKWGAVSSMLQYELGGYQHNSDDWNIYTGPGAGLRLYLKKIAVPAVGLDLAYNTLNNEFRFSLTMGMGMKMKK